MHALIGENGAGKSTLIQIITGAVDREAERSKSAISSLNNSPRLAKSRRRRNLPAASAFQELSVAENISLGSEKSGLWRRVNWPERRRRASELLARISAKIDPQADAGDLSMPQQRLVEIARALGADARVLIMDEPGVAFEEDTQNLFRVIRELRGQGVGVIYISHRFGRIARDCRPRNGAARWPNDRHTLDQGVNRDELIQLMVGRELSAVFPKKAVELRDVVLELRNLVARRRMLQGKSHRASGRDRWPGGPGGQLAVRN